MIGVGSKVGSYDIVAELRRGGMATLYLGLQAGPGGFNRHVAIKVVHEHLAQRTKFVEMFLDEARLCSRISHPNVVHVEALGEQDGQHYLVMEYLQGVTFAEVLLGLVTANREAPIDLIVSIAAQVADGLHGAHETTDEDGYPLNVIHRDVSPQNVIVTASGHVKLIDFGVAKARGRLQVTEAGNVRGKIAYMSPEQATGGKLDRRTDVFSVGILLWEALALRRLFRGRHELETMTNVREKEIEPPSKYRPDLPPALDAVVLSALSRNPGGRPATAMLLRRALLKAVPDALFVEPEAIARLVQDTASAELAARRAQVGPEVEKTLVSGLPDMTSAPTTNHRIQRDRSPNLRPAGALSGLARAEDDAREKSDPVALAHAIGRHAVALIDAGEVSRAENKLDEAEALIRTRALGLRPHLGRWRGHLAAARGDLGARLLAYQEAVKLSEEAGLPHAAVASALSLADCYNRIGDYPHAEQGLAEAIARMKQLGYRTSEGYGHLNLALARGMQGQLEKAFDDLSSAEAIAHVHQDAHLKVFCDIYRAKILLNAHSPNEAARIAELAANQAAELGMPSAEIMGCVIAALARLEVGNHPRGLSLARRAHERWLAEGGTDEEEAELFVALARAHEANNQPQRAAEVRAMGRERILQTATRIADDEIRERFLSVPARAELLR